MLVFHYYFKESPKIKKFKLKKFAKDQFSMLYYKNYVLESEFILNENLLSNFKNYCLIYKNAVKSISINL